MNLWHSYNKRQRITALLLLLLGFGLMTSCSHNTNSADKAASPASTSASAGASSKASESVEATASSATTEDTPIQPTDRPSTTATAPAAPSASQHTNSRQGNNSGSGNGGAASSTPEASPSNPPTQADLALSHNSLCDISDETVLRIIKAQGWEDGPYTTNVTYSSTSSGPYVKYGNIDHPDNMGVAANPMNGWQWPCHEPDGDDPVGFYQLWFTDANTGVRKSETVNFQVVS